MKKGWNARWTRSPDAMSQSELRRRMALGRESQKITDALRMTASSRQRRLRLQLAAFLPYAQALETMTARLQPPLMPQRRLTVIFASDMGLCGAYLPMLRKAALSKVSGPCVIIGRKAQSWRMPDAEVIAGSTAQLSALAARIEPADTAVHVLYTARINALSAEVKMVKIWPLPMADPHVLQEPEAMWRMAAEDHLAAALRRYALEAKLSEQAMRAMAMEEAGENAKRLLETLQRQYHRERQALITREITELAVTGEMDDE